MLGRSGVKVLAVGVACVLSLGFIVLKLLAPPSQKKGAEHLSTLDVREGFKRHAALAQFHRWYLFYEKPAYGLTNALDILDDAVVVKSGLGEAKGHAQYAERVQKFPTTWKNAHNVKATRVTISPNGQVQLSADVSYLNQGILENNAVRTAELSYTTTLTPTQHVLPKFTRIEIAQKSNGTASSFASAYGQNRLLSLVHYWLALIEDPRRDPNPAKEILADSFSLNFPSGAVTTFDGFKTWLAGPASQVTASTHKISNFSHETTGENTYSLTMDFDWHGILPNNAEMTAKTRHSWTVRDDPAERFARIGTMDIEILKPFAPKAQD